LTSVPGMRPATDGPVDIAYLRAHPAHVEAFLTHQRIRTTPVPGGDICAAQRLTLDDGSDLFAKTVAEPPPGFFTAEARGLRWLGEAGAPVPDVVAATGTMLVLSWVEPGAPTPGGAEELGRTLAAMHAAGADGFGAPWDGYIGTLPLDNRRAERWPQFYAERRLRPYLRMAADQDALPPAGVAVLDRLIEQLTDGSTGLAGPDEPPARIHGDLWSGNVHYDIDGRAWLIDPAAHGGHRETDLAMLRLFGAPYLDRTLAAYAEMSPLADGAAERVALHQLHSLLVHAALFGGGYGGQAVAAAERALSRRTTG
jgi:fructosamine-3-kinase